MVGGGQWAPQCGHVQGQCHLLQWVSLLQTGTSLEGKMENLAGLKAPGCVFLVLRGVGGECAGDEGGCGAASTPTVPGARVYRRGDVPLGALKGQIFRINYARPFPPLSSLPSLAFPSASSQ